MLTKLLVANVHKMSDNGVITSALFLEMYGILQAISVARDGVKK
jgi:hypothetical protein